MIECLVLANPKQSHLMFTAVNRLYLCEGTEKLSTCPKLPNNWWSNDSNLWEGEFILGQYGQDRL